MASTLAKARPAQAEDNYYDRMAAVNGKQGRAEVQPTAKKEEAIKLGATRLPPVPYFFQNTSKHAGATNVTNLQTPYPAAALTASALPATQAYAPMSSGATYFGAQPLDAEAALNCSTEHNRQLKEEIKQLETKCTRFEAFHDGAKEEIRQTKEALSKSEVALSKSEAQLSTSTAALSCSTEQIIKLKEEIKR